jgi:voltage-gated potassium channel
MITIIVSIIPLAFKTTNVYFNTIDKVTTILFIIDYALRWFTADKKLKRDDAVAYIAYPFMPMAIIDLLSILPGVVAINQSLRLLRLIRGIKMFRLFKVFKAFRYSKSVGILVRAFEKEKDTLLVILWIAFAYIMVSALIIFNVEPKSFNTFFDAVYWATVSLTTVGYGDIYPVTAIGRVVAMISSLFGIAIVAMPAGVITAGLLDELQNKKSK